MNETLIESLLPLVSKTSRRLAPTLPYDHREEMEAAMRVDLCVRMAQFDARKGSSAQTWAIGALLIAGKQWLRSENRRWEHLPSESLEGCAPAADLRDVRPSPEDAAVISYEQRRIREAVARLPALQRSAVKMRFWDEMVFRDIGNHLGVSKQAAHKTCESGMRILSETLN